ncbi:MAG TPA: MFS transporter, partial [Clostridia bacterium]|nr:MFS transporter [Clostridia bacterium]
VNALVAEIYPEKSVYYLNFTQVFFGLGSLFGPVAAGLLVSAKLGWQVCYIGMGVILLASAAIFAGARMPVNGADKIRMDDVLGLIKDKRLLLLCLSMFLYTGAEVGGWGWLSTFLRADLAFSPVKSSAAVGVFWLAMIVGRIIYSRFFHHIDTRRLIIGYSLGAGISAMLAGIISNQHAVWVTIALTGLTYSCIWALIVAYGNELYGKYKGTVFALLIGSGGLGAAVLPLALGLIAQELSIRAAIASPALFLLFITFIFAKRKV